MSDVFDDLGVAGGRLRVVCAAGQGRGGRVAGALLPHSFHFPFLRLRELCGDDDQAQVDHEEGADLWGNDVLVNFLLMSS